MFLKSATRFLTVNCVRGFSSKSSMNQKLQGKVAVVTASTDGIGFAIAKRLGQDGAKVVVSSRKQANVDRALDDLKKENVTAIGVVCHVAKEEHRIQLFEKAVKEFGGIDILVSNAAANPAFGPILDTTEAQWDKPLGSYSVSKTALLGLTKALAPQCGAMNVRVNCLAPGIIKTKFSEALTSDGDLSEKVKEGIPLKRFGTPEDCAGIVSFLSSDDASYITGETVLVTGGMASRL